MEPERKIEKLLRAYAKKRGGQAGDPLKLHPATRRMLHDEIARNAPKPDEEDAFLSLWELFRQRWAFLLGFALIVFFVTTLFLPALSSSKHKGQRATTKYNLMEIGTAVRMFAEDNNQRLPASLDELTNELQLDLINTILTDPQNGQRFVYVGGGKSLDNLQSNSILAYSPTDKKGRAVLFADGRVDVINAARFSELTNRGVQELAFAKDSARQQLAATPAVTTPEIGYATPAPPISGKLQAENSRREVKLGEVDKYAPAQTNTTHFASTDSAHLGSQNLFRNISKANKAVLVLANFQVQQNGNVVRIVDADGSVYDGSLLQESAVVQNGPASATTPAPPAITPTQVEQAKTSADQEKLQTVQNYFFRAAGTNRTLKQNVVFAGNLVVISNETTNLQQTFSGSGGNSGGQMQSAPTNQNQLPWSNSRIVGTAAIAETNHIEINAVPLSP
ncbi:MAG: hypothetical protein ACLP7I_12235 [Limisphaerales bacterium]